MRLGDFAALSFDCYGTLIDWERGILAALRPWRAARGVRASDEALFAAFGRAEAAVQAAHPRARYPEILARALRDLGTAFGAAVSEAEGAAFGASVKAWPAFPDSAAALAYLARHYKLLVVSNVDRASFRASEARLGVRFDAVITAEDAGAYKPAHNHFRLAFARLAGMGIGRERLLHVAQSIFHDHVPAKALGLATVWINRRGEAAALPEGVRPDWEVPSLAALADRHRAEAA